MKCIDAKITHHVCFCLRNFNRNRTTLLKDKHAEIHFLSDCFNHSWCEIHCNYKKFTAFLKKIVQIIKLFDDDTNIVENNASAQKMIADELNTIVSKEFIILCAQQIRKKKCIFFSNFSVDVLDSDCDDDYDDDDGSGGDPIIYNFD